MLIYIFNRLGKKLEANRPKSDFTIDVQHEVSTINAYHILNNV